MSKTLLRHTLIKKYFWHFCRLPQCDTYAVCTLGHEAVSPWSCETGTRSNWSIGAMSFLKKMVGQGYNGKYNLIFKCHIAPVRHIHYITMICTFSIWSLHSIIYNYGLHTQSIFIIIKLRRSFFPNADGLSQITLSKFNNDRYSLFRKSIMILLYYTKPETKNLFSNFV